MIRTTVKQFKPYSPGLSIAEIKNQYQLTSVIKMASNENPLGMSPLVIEAVSKKIAEAFRYPRPGSPKLRRAIARHLQLSEENIVVGNGSDEIIDLLIRCTAEPGKNNILVFSPSFSIYRMQGLLHGVKIKDIPLNTDFSFPLNNLLASIDENTSLVFLTNPDNPSGFALDRYTLLEFAKQIPKDTLLVIDEAYIDFAHPIEKYTLLDEFLKKGLKNVVILRTFSKIYALAGLRIGYAIAEKEIASHLLRIKLPFSVNHLAETAAAAALQDTYFYQYTKSMVTNERRRLQKEITGLHCTPYPSQTNFIMFSTPLSADHLFKELLKKGIIIRSLKSYGLPNHLRVTIGTPEENTTFLSTLADILNLA